MAGKREQEKSDPRFLALPRTGLGWWSVGLAAGFFVFMCLFFLQVHSPGRDRSTFFSDPINALLLIGASASGIGGGLVALFAVFLKRERSFILVPIVLLGLLVLGLTLMELLELL